MTRVLCQSRSRFGKCRLDKDHASNHAIPIGDDIWFVYPRGKGKRKPLGYAKWGALSDGYGWVAS